MRCSSVSLSLLRPQQQKNVKYLPMTLRFSHFSHQQGVRGFVFATCEPQLHEKGVVLENALSHIHSEFLGSRASQCSQSSEQVETHTAARHRLILHVSYFLFLSVFSVFKCVAILYFGGALAFKHENCWFQKGSNSALQTTSTKRTDIQLGRTQIIQFPCK